MIFKDFARVMDCAPCSASIFENEHDYRDVGPQVELLAAALIAVAAWLHATFHVH